MLMNKVLNKKSFIKSYGKTFSSSIYIWLSNVSPGRRADDYKNKLQISNHPKKIEFFEGKNPKYVYMGPRHSGVITDKGELYTFGSGNWGVLGHGDENNVNIHEPKVVEYFIEKNLKVKKVCMGDFHTIALTDDGSVYTWGFGGKPGFLNLLFRDTGALGHGDRKDVFTPKKVKFFSDNKIKIKDIASGTRHCVAVTTDGLVYCWGKGEFGLIGNGSNKDSVLPLKNDFLEMYSKENPENEIKKIDCADEYTAALTKGGELYVWGKNNQGQLGIGAGIGVDFTESEKFPTLVVKPKDVKYLDVSCGDNNMMMIDDYGNLHKTGWRIDYTPSIIQISKIVKPNKFFCGNSYYCMIDENNKIYQWGNLFKQSLAEKTDSDMQMIISDDLFDKKEIQMISGKFKMCAAIVKS